MSYYKKVKNGYIRFIGTGASDEEITKEEYENILFAIRNRPIAEPGHDYYLKTDLTWELVETPIEDNAEATEAEERDIPDSEALNIITGGSEE